MRWSHSTGVLLTLMTLSCGDADSAGSTGGGNATGTGGAPLGTGGGGGGEVTKGSIESRGEPEPNGGAGGGGGDIADCPGEPVMGTGVATFNGELAPAQYARAMMGAGFVPAPEALSFGALREAIDDIEQPRFNAWIDYSDAGPPTLQVRQRISITGEPIEQLVIVVDLSSSNEAIDSLRSSVLRSLARGVDDLGVELLVVGFGGEPIELGNVKGGVSADQPDIGAAEALAIDLEFPTADGHNLEKAISFAVGQGLSERAHVLVLTDGGFTPSAETLFAIEQLTHSAETSRRLSIAQLSHLEGFAHDKVPGPRTELRRETLASVASTGRGVALFLHDGDLDCVGAENPCLHNGIASGFEPWFAASAQPPSVDIHLPVGVSFVDAGDGAPGSDAWVPAEGTLALSAELSIDTMCNVTGSIAVTWNSSFSVALVPFTQAFSHTEVNARLRDIVRAMRSQSGELPNATACTELQILSNGAVLCDAAGETDAALCAYAVEVESFYQEACATLCGEACSSLD